MNFHNLRLFFSLILIFVSIICDAQPKYGFENYLFQRTHFVFSFTPTYSFKAKTQLTSGNQNLKPENLLGAEAGLGLVYNLTDELGIKTGSQGGVTPYDFSYEITSPYDSLFGHPIPPDFTAPPYGFDGYFFGYINVPLQLEFRQKISDNKYFLGAAGLALKWTFAKPANYGYSTSTSDTTSEDFLLIHAEKAKKHITIPLTLSVGVGFVLKNKNMLIVNVKSETGFENVVDGEYVFFPNKTYKSTGTYAKKGSYVGLEVGYRLTKGRESQSMSSPDAYEYIHNKGYINTTIDSAAIVKIFKRNQIGVAIGYQFNLKPLITSTKGDEPNITTLPFPKFSIDYTFNKNKNWGIKTGLSYSVYRYQYNDITYKGSTGVPVYTNEIYFGWDIFTAYCNFEYRYQLKKSFMLYSDLGFTAGMFSERGVTYASAVDYSLVNAQNIVTGQVHERALLGSNVGLGILYATKNYNIWRIGANWFNSFTTGITENYLFNRGAANEQTGTTAIKGSNVALSLGYVYSFSPSPYAIEKRKLKIQTMEQFPKPYITSNLLDSIYTKNQFAISSELNFMMQPKATVQYGSAPLIDTYGTLGFKADYLFSLNKHWSAAAGLGVNRYTYDIESYSIFSADSISYVYNIDNYITTLAFNASAEYRLPISRSALWYTDFGLSIGNNFMDEYSYLSQKGPDSTSIVTHDEVTSSLNVGGFIGTGILLTCRNYNQFKIGVQYYQSFSPLLKQEYEIRTYSGEPSAAGSITSSGNYISVNVGYVFSFKKSHNNKR